MFPQLPSGNNPAAAMASTFASSAHAVLNSLKSAQYQHAELAARRQAAQQAAREKGLADELEAHRMGLIPVEGPGDQVNDPGYTVNDPGAAPGTPGNVMPVLRGERQGGSTGLGYNRPGFEAAAQASANGDPGVPEGSEPDQGFAGGKPPAAPMRQMSPPAQLVPPANQQPSGRDPNRMVQVNGKWFYDPTKAERGEAFIPKKGSKEEQFMQGATEYKSGDPVTPGLYHDLQQGANEQKARETPKEEKYTLIDVQDSSGKRYKARLNERTGKAEPIDLSHLDQPPQMSDTASEAEEHGYSGPPAQQVYGGMPDGAFAPVAQGPGAGLGGLYGGGLPNGAFPATTEAAQPSAAPAQQGGGYSFAQPQPRREPAAPAPLVSTSTNKNGDVTRTALDRQGNVLWTHVDKGVGKPMRPRAEAGQKPMTPATGRTIRNQHDADFKKADADFQKALKDPGLDADGLKQAVAERHAARQAAQNKFIQNIREATHNPDLEDSGGLDQPDYTDNLTIDSIDPATGRITGGTAKTPATTQASGTPAKTPAPTAQAKTATMAQVRAYAAKNGLSEADAVRKVRGEGFSIGK